MVCAITTVFSQNITKAEYFFDTDPGLGNGTSIIIPSPAETVNFSANIPTTGLNSGFHLLTMRVYDVNGRWSRSESRGFYIWTQTTNTGNITAAEYFFDSDPGPGNGIATSVGTSGSVVTFTASIPANFSTGFHFLGIRTKDSDGKWGFFDKRSFYVSGTTPDMPAITAAEYFFDHDPGQGNGTSLTINSPGYVISQNFTINIPNNLSDSTHLLTIRVKDLNGNWGLFQKTTITVTNTTVNCPSNVIVNTASGQCTSIVNNIDPVISPSGALYTYTLTGATTGSGNGSASGLTFNAGTTTVSYALTNSPGINCSFTVTVNANVLPLVNIDASTTTICSGNQVTFTAYPMNGGATPSYQWKRNGNNVGGNSATYQNSNLSNNDEVKVVMTSSVGCANPQSATSNTITIAVTQTATPSVTISGSATAICPGTTVTFTAIPTNSGSTPFYQWKLNGNNVGTNNATYQNSSLVNGDVVSCVMTSSLTCASQPTVASNNITITVSSSVIPSVIISATATTICSGQQVTFTATPSNGGNSPTYQWKLNGNNAGTNSNIYQNSSLSNNDIVSATMISSLACVLQPIVSSNNVPITVTSTVTPSVSIVANSTALCPGSTASFTATPANGGNPSYQWKLNGNNVGINSDLYENSDLINGDQVYVIMTSSLNCVTSLTGTSNTIKMGPSQAVTPDVSITASATSICPETMVTFTATSTNGGEFPVYEWKKNGEDVGTNSNVYQANELVNGDVITVLMSSWLNCVTKPTDTSNAITINVVSSVMPSISIAASATTICSGQQVTFIATPANGGNNPVYEWTLNNNAVGSDSSIYQSSTLQNGDVVRVTMSSSSSCADHTPVYSNSITITAGTITPSVSIAASDSAICSGTPVTFTATPSSGGDNPHYEWTVNGIEVGTNSGVYQNSALSNGDTIKVYMTSSSSCASPSLAISNKITMVVRALTTYYRDKDGDGYGSSLSGTMKACAATSGYVADNSDCNDNDSSIHPGATEICANGIDDNCNGAVDENCDTTSTLPVMTVRMYPVKEGDVGYTMLNVQVTLDKPAPLPVAVHYSTSDEDATARLDYVAASGWLHIPVGSLSATIQFRIIGDLLREKNERFTINYADPVNVTFNGEPRSQVMIIDDDKRKINNTIAHVDKIAIGEQLLKIPNLAKRNQVWMIPQIGEYENEILIINAQGQPVSRFVNYQNYAPLNNVAAGLYFYQIRTLDGDGQVKYYSGRLLITE